MSDIDVFLHFDFILYRQLYYASFLSQYLKVLSHLSVCPALVILAQVLPATEEACFVGVLVLARTELIFYSSWVWWCPPLVPADREAEPTGSLEPREPNFLLQFFLGCTTLCEHIQDCNVILYHPVPLPVVGKRDCGFLEGRHSFSGQEKAWCDGMFGICHGFYV